MPSVSCVWHFSVPAGKHLRRFLLTYGHLLPPHYRLHFCWSHGAMLRKLHFLLSWQQKFFLFSQIPLRQTSSGISSFQELLHHLPDRPVPSWNAALLPSSFLLPHKKTFWLFPSVSDVGNWLHPYPSGSISPYLCHFSQKHQFPHKQTSNVVFVLAFCYHRSDFSGCLLCFLIDQHVFLSVSLTVRLRIFLQVWILFRLQHGFFFYFAVYYSVQNPHFASLSVSVPVHLWIFAQKDEYFSHSVQTGGKTYPQGLLLFPPVFLPSAHHWHGYWHEQKIYPSGFLPPDHPWSSSGLSCPWLSFSVLPLITPPSSDTLSLPVINREKRCQKQHRH